MAPVVAGTLLVGKYRIESLIGRGGMGSVWRGEHLALGAPVAIKLLDDFSNSAEALGRFHREARAAAAIRSPHVVQILDHGVDEGLGAPFIVMELMEGESLAQRLTRRGCLGPAEAAQVFVHVARALTRAHEANIVHRDLKPDNVFLVRNEDEEIAKVLDFGIAKSKPQEFAVDSGTRTGTVMGTAYYMSPEQISDAKTVDFRSDIWAMGVMACECLTGRRPFEAESIGGMTLKICVGTIPLPSSLAVVPVGFDEWFMKCVKRDPAQRFSSAREAAEALRSVCVGGASPGRVTKAPAPSPNATIVSSSSPPAVPRHTFTEAPFSRSATELQPAFSKPRRTPWVALAGAFAAAIAVAFFLFRPAPSRPTEAVASSRASAEATARAPVLTVAPAACEANARDCLQTIPRTCIAGQWAAAAITAGQCGAACTPGSSSPRCDNGAPQSCSDTGQWQTGAACPAGKECRAGECAWKRAVPGIVTSPPPMTPSPPPPPSVLPPRPDCSPSYTLDSQGQKHFKPECFR